MYNNVMTFNEALADFDRIYLGEPLSADVAHDAYASGDRQDYLFQAASEISSKLAIPRLRHANSYAGTNLLEITVSGISNIEKIFGKVFVNGNDLDIVGSYQAMLAARNRSTYLKSFVHDRAYDTGKIAFNYPVTNPVVAFEYLPFYDPLTMDGTDDIWNGKYEAYHFLVPIRAANKAWIARTTFGAARFFVNEYNRDLKKLCLEVGTPEAYQELQLLMPEQEVQQ